MLGVSPVAKFADPRRLWARLRVARADLRTARVNSEALVDAAFDAGAAAERTARDVVSLRDELVALRADLSQATGIIEAGTQRAVNAFRAELLALRADISEATAAIEAKTAEAIAATRTEIAATRIELSGLRGEAMQAAAEATSNHERTLLGLRMVRDNDAAARSALWSLRSSEEYAAAFEQDEPLVTILITTYMNWPLLRDRSLPSIVAQTYENWEAIVVGDAAPDEARRVVEAFGDSRMRFVNLPYRGPYPENARDAWLVSGTTPWNTGLALANGLWIGSNSDDDALRPRYVESLLAQARVSQAEVPYGYIEMLKPDGPSDKLGVFPPTHGQWGMQASLLHAGLRFLPLQPSDWVFGVPNDSSLLERMLRIGVRFSMVEETVADYYPSQLWSDREDRLIRRDLF